MSVTYKLGKHWQSKKIFAFAYTDDNMMTSRELSESEVEDMENFDFKRLGYKTYSYDGDGPESHDWQEWIPLWTKTDSQTNGLEFERVERLALECLKETGDRLNGFMWFTVPAHLRDRVEKRRLELKS